MLPLIGGCEKTTCESYAICESDGKSGSRCVCPTTCVQVRPLPPCVYIHTCTCIQTIHMYMCTYVHTTYMHTYVHTYYIHIIHTYTKHTLYMHACMHVVHVYMCACVHMNPQTHARAHTQMNARMHIIYICKLCFMGIYKQPRCIYLTILFH